MRIRYIGDILLLIITNFVVWSWALEKHPKPDIQLARMHNTTHIGAIIDDFVKYKWLVGTLIIL